MTDHAFTFALCCTLALHACTCWCQIHSQYKVKIVSRRWWWYGQARCQWENLEQRYKNIAIYHKMKWYKMKWLWSDFVALLFKSRSVDDLLLFWAKQKISYIYLTWLLSFWFTSFIYYSLCVHSSVFAPPTFVCIFIVVAVVFRFSVHFYKCKRSMTWLNFILFICSMNSFACGLLAESFG